MMTGMMPGTNPLTSPMIAEATPTPTRHAINKSTNLKRITFYTEAKNLVMRLIGRTLVSVLYAG